MDTDKDIQDRIIEDLKKEGYFSIRDNSAKTKIRTKLATIYGVEPVWIKDVVTNGYGKEGRRIDDSKIIAILGSDASNISISKTNEDPAEGIATVINPPGKFYFVSSAPGQAGIGLMKIKDAIKKHDFKGLIIINNGNDGPLSDDDFNGIKETFDELQIYSSAVFNGGISHIPDITYISETNTIDRKNLTSFIAALKEADLFFIDKIIQRTKTSLLSKSFLVFTGLSGSGKTKLAQAFARWLTPDPGYVSPTDKTKGKNPNPFYKVVSVGADWSGNENILGYPNGLHPEEYFTKPALELILHAKKDEHKNDPHFLILDEMNLSHVERYFADILSAIESDEKIHLHRDEKRTAGAGDIEPEIGLPKNLFIIGTVNIDETTHMFSPKVLDRANVIEFRMKDTELASFLEKPVKPNLDQLDGKGKEFGQAFVGAAKNPADVPDSAKLHFQCEMLLFFKVLQKHGAEFGYRVAHEAGRFVHFYEKLGGETDVDKWFKDAFDCVIVQKFLPKLHGSETKLRGVLFSLAHLCANKREWTGATLKDNEERIDELAIEAKTKADSSENSPIKLEENLKTDDKAPHYPLSFEKIERMWRAAHENGFASFAES
jgi:energy-coupling factor transporter ATP-binding protein EcfA2